WWKCTSPWICPACTTSREVPDRSAWEPPCSGGCSREMGLLRPYQLPWRRKRGDLAFEIRLDVLARLVQTAQERLPTGDGLRGGVAEGAFRHPARRVKDAVQRLAAEKH